MIILDTCILIDIIRGRSEVKEYLKNIEEECVISAITIEEIYAGLGMIQIKQPDSAFQSQMRITQNILSEYEIIQISPEILQNAGIMRGTLKAKGRRVSPFDLIIGASAQIINATKLITRNVKHFDMWKFPVQSYPICQIPHNK